MINQVLNKHSYSVVISDLEYTIIKTDLLWESIFLFIRKTPLNIIILVWWLIRGKAFLKMMLSKNVKLNLYNLPYDNDVIQFLNSEKRDGNKIVIISTWDKTFVAEIARHLNIEDFVAGSEFDKMKKEGVTKIVGGRQFIYIGHSRADDSLWQSAQKVYATRGAKDLATKLTTLGKPVTFIGEKRHTGSLINGLRPYHWVKNILVFLPLIFAHQFGNYRDYQLLIITFVSMCLCASSAYIFNDLLDLESDRQHKTKRNRVFASGLVSIKEGITACVILALLGIGLVIAYLPFSCQIIIIIYLATTIAYSTYLKCILMIDIIVLAFLYTLRIFAGGEAVGVHLSAWFVTFSLFFFLSLAFLKRYIELSAEERQINVKLKGRNYFTNDIPVVIAAGVSSSYLCVLIYFLYVANSSIVTVLYPRSHLLWLIGPVLLYWFGRVWFVAYRGRMDSDPVMFALKDKPSWGVLAISVVIVFLASLS